MHRMVRFEEAARRISEDCSCNRARQAARTLTKLYDELMRPSGLLLSQATLLVAIARFGEQGANMARLADVLVMDRTTLTRNLRPLESAGLLRVARAPNDDRLRVLFLTRAGERKIEAAYPLWERAQQVVRKGFGERRADTVRDDLAELVGAMQELDAPGESRPAPKQRRSKR
jgi:DNA-binding MarR family transcriptional regulator